MVRMGDDCWAIYSQDGSLAADFEFTIAITPPAPHPDPWHHPAAASADDLTRRGLSSCMFSSGDVRPSSQT